MANSIEIYNLPDVVNATAPILHNPNQVGSYGTTADDVIIPDAQPAVLKALPLDPSRPIIRHSDEPVPWNKNPIDREDLVNPVEIPSGATFTNRNLLLKVLNVFLFPRHNNDNVTFSVSRVGNVIYYGSLHQAPGPVTDANGVPLPAEPGRYGFPFEKLIATSADPNLEKFFVFQSYSLLGVSQLLVRSEVDCVNQDNDIAEIKSKKTPNYSIWNDSAYFKTVWAQMLFGCAESLVVGLHVPVPRAADGTAQVQFENISTRTFEEVAVLAKMDTEERYMPCLKSLVNLIEWIRANIADGENKTFSYSKREQKFILE